MVAALAAAGIGAGLSALGGLLGGKNSKKVAKQQQKDIDNFNALNSAEFDKRQGYIRGSDDRVNAIEDESFETLLPIRNEAFDSSTANRDKGVREQTGVTRDFAGRRGGMEKGFSARGKDLGMDFADRNAGSDISFADRRGSLNEGNFAKLGQIGATQDQGFEKGFKLLGQRSGAERERAAGMFKAGAADLTGAVADLGKGKFSADLDTSGAARQRALGYASSGATPAGVTGSGKFAEALADQTATGVATGRQQGDLDARVSSYGDAMGRRDERLAGLGSRLQTLDDKAKLSKQAYESEAAAAKQIIENADATAEERREAAALDLDAFMGVLKDEQARDRAALADEERGAFTNLDEERNREGKILDDAERRDSTLLDDINKREGEDDEAYYADLVGTLTSMYEGLTAAEADYLAKLITSSEGRVNVEQALTQFRVGNTKGTPSLLANAAAGAGSTLMSAGLNKWVS